MLISFRPNKWLPTWNPIFLGNDPVKDITPWLLHRGQPCQLSEVLLCSVQTPSLWQRMFFSASKVLTADLLLRVSFYKEMAATNDKVSWWRGSHGVYSPPETMSKILVMCGYSAPRGHLFCVDSSGWSFPRECLMLVQPCFFFLALLFTVLLCQDSKRESVSITSSCLSAWNVHHAHKHALRQKWLIIELNRA